MHRLILARWLWPLVYVVASGCGQYLGYRVESTKEVGREERIVKKGKPSELKVDLATPATPSLLVHIHTSAVRDDVELTTVTMQELRVHAYSKNDLFIIEPVAEALVAALGVVGGWQVAMKEGDAHWICTCPVADLVARIFGGHGINGIESALGSGGTTKEGKPLIMERPVLRYESHAPGYFRRLGQWSAWLLPGYTMVGLNSSPGLVTRTELVQRKDVTKPRVERREPGAARAITALTVSCDPSHPLTATTDANGAATFDLTRPLYRAWVGREVTLTVKAEHAGLTAETSRTFKAEELGVTWTKPRFREQDPPSLEVAAVFNDPNSNGRLDAAEQAEIAVSLTNRGKGDAFLLTIKDAFDTQPQMVSMEARGSTTLETLPVGQKHTFRFAVAAQEEVPAQQLSARFTFDEINGFQPEPVIVEFSARPYDPPKLVLTRWEIDDDSFGASIGDGDRVLQRGELAEITLFIQNTGTGPGERVSVSAETESPHTFVRMDGSSLGTIPAGEWERAVLSIMVNNRLRETKEIPVQIAVQERRPKFAVSKSLMVPCRTVGVERDPRTFDLAWFGVSWQGQKPQPTMPPQLVAKAALRDPSGERVLDANETAEIALTLVNRGRGQAHLVAAKASLSSTTKGVTLRPKGPTSVKTLGPDQEHTFLFAVSAEEEVAAQNVQARFVLYEFNGFEPDPVGFRFTTRPYDRPRLVIAGWELDDDKLGKSFGNANSVLDPGEKAEITLTVENQGAGVAQGVVVTCPAEPAPALSVQVYGGSLHKIMPGQSKKALLTLMVSPRYGGPKEIPLRIKLDEQRPTCRVDAAIEVKLGERHVSSIVVHVEPKEGRRESKPVAVLDRVRMDKPVAEGQELPLASRVYALLIGISKYQSGIPELSYAAKDAQDMYALLRSHGVREDHLNLITDSGATLFKVQSEVHSWLTRAKDGIVIIHWSGHGFEDQNNPEEAYFACYDTPKDVPTAGYRMKSLADRVKTVGARQVVMLLDTCHAGTAAYRGERGVGGVVGGAADGFARYMQEQSHVPSGMVIIAAGDADRKSLESANWQNGMLTHVVLRALRGQADGYLDVAPKDGTVTLGELKTYVEGELPKVTSDLGIRACHPVVATLRGTEAHNGLPIILLKKD